MCNAKEQKLYFNMFPIVFFFSMTAVLRHFKAHSDCLLSFVLYESFIDQIYT